MQLPEPLTGETVSLEQLSAGAKATLVIFMCNHCPFVKHIMGEPPLGTLAFPQAALSYLLELLSGPLAQLAKDMQAKGTAVVGISANSVETHPQDGPVEMAKLAVSQGLVL